MTNNKPQSKQKPAFLKFGMYFSEIVIANILFFLFFGRTMIPVMHDVTTIPPLYGWMAMTFTMAYCMGVMLHPITFFYRGSRNGSIFANVTMALVWMLIAFLLVLVIESQFWRFRTWRLPVIFCVLWCALVVWRFVCRGIVRYMRSMGRNVHEVVFVGCNDNILEMYDEMSLPHYGYSVVGYFADYPNEKAPTTLEWLGTVGDVEPWLATHQVEHLYCCLPSVMGEKIRDIIDMCESHCVHFFSVPNVRNYLKRQFNMEMLGSVPVLSIREDPLSSLTNRVLKRLMDLLLAGLFMIPFWLLVFPVVAICTKILQPGPVFFKQKRDGLNGKPFMCYKFRSMKVNAEADLLQATADDPRKTPFGDFLRRSSIDELPQFINVLKGEMSIVGPRPHMVRHTEEYRALIDKYMVRHWVRPGITGWAQVNGARGETRELWQMEDRIRKDIWYIEHWSLLLDVRIMCMTVWHAIVGDKQAY